MNEIQKKDNQARRLSITALKAIKIRDLHSKINDIFIWTLECIYDVPQSQYWWGNFKKQIFEKDNGKDFKNRMIGHET